MKTTRSARGGLPALAAPPTPKPPGRSGALGIVPTQSEVIAPGDDSIEVVAQLRPFNSAITRRHFAAGTTLADILEELQPHEVLRRCSHIFIGGERVRRHLWRRVRPKPGTRVKVTTLPKIGGGGKKNPLRFILQLAVVAASFIVPAVAVPAGAVLFGGAISVSSLVGAAIFGLGSLLINAFIPAQQARVKDLNGTAGRDSPALAIQGIRNQARPYGVVPRLYGKMRIFPYYGSKPFTEIRGKDQFFRIVFDLGYGPLNISDLRIGATPIDDYQDVHYEIRQGFLDDEPLTLYTRIPQEEGLQILLQPGQWVKQTTKPDADEISVDLSALSGLTSFDSSGDKLGQTIEFDIEYSVKDAEDWRSVTAPVTFGVRQSQTMKRPAPQQGIRKQEGQIKHVVRIYRFSLDRISGKIAMVSGNSSVANPFRNKPLCSVSVSSNPAVALGITDERTSEFTIGNHFQPTLNGMKVQVGAGTLNPPDFVMADNSTAVVRRNLAWKVDRDQYDVHIRRITPDLNTDNVFDDIHWTALRSFTDEAPIAAKGHALIALEIRATDQLNGMVDQLNCIAESILWDYDENLDDWVERPTSNCAAVYRDLHMGTINPKPIDGTRMDWDSIEAWAEECRAAGREFNAYLDFEQTLLEAANMVAATGRATRGMRDGKYSLVRDIVQTVPAEHITPRNSWGWRTHIEYPDLPHAFRAGFKNRHKDWVYDQRIVPFDGWTEETAAEFLDIDLVGVTDPDQVFLECRYREADMKLRREQHFVNMDFEHLLAREGSLVTAAHDVILVGICSGRIKSLTLDVGDNVLGFTGDELMAMEPGKDYSVTIRTLTNKKITKALVLSVGGNSTVTFVDPIPAAEAASVELSAGDLYSFGLAGLEVGQYVVKTITNRTADHEARLELRDYNPAVLAADGQPIPPFESKITLPSQFDFRAPEKPQVESVRSDELVLVRQPDGSLESRILIVLARKATLLPPAVQIKVRFKRSDAPAGAWINLAPLPGDATEVSVSPVDDKVAYDVELAAVAADGSPSEWTRIAGHEVIGKSSPPPDVLTLLIETTTSGRRRARITYPEAPPDFRGFVWKRLPGTLRDWSQGQLMSDDPVTGTVFDLPLLDGTWTIMVKAVDTSGNESLSAAVAIINLGGAPDLNIVLTRDYGAEGFPGSVIDGAVESGDLKADDSGDAFWTNDAAPFWTNDTAPFWTSTYLAMTYIARFAPDASHLPARLRLQTEVTASSWSLSYRPSGSQAPWWDEDTTQPMWTGPSDPMWDPAPDFVPWPGEIALLQQQYEFRVNTSSGAVRGVISDFVLVLDVEDLVETFEDVAVPAGGLRLPITKPFRKILRVIRDLQHDGGNAVNINLIDKDVNLGPLVRGIDGATPPNFVASTGDFRVEGY